MLFAPAFDDNILPPDHREALRLGCISLTDKCFYDVEMASHEGWSIHDAELASYLPPVRPEDFTSALIKQFTVCVLTVSWKLAQPIWTPLACLAEELALYCVVAEAKMRRRSPDSRFEPFMEAALHNLDFEYLYDENVEPNWDIQPGNFARSGPLSLRDWTSPFDEKIVQIHPYIEVLEHEHRVEAEGDS